MQLTVKTLLDLVDGIAPFCLQEKWDNSGLQAGSLIWSVKRVLVALDVTMDVMDCAADLGADLVLTHHPLMIRPENQIEFDSMPGAAVFASATGKIAIVSAHTNLDRARNGLNDRLAEIIGLTNISTLEQPGWAGAAWDDSWGIGRKGVLDQPLTLMSLAEHIKGVLGLTHLRIVGDPDLVIKRVALCTGSGASFINDFFSSGAQVYITGDMKYHDARQVEQAGLCLIDAGHFASEHIVVELLVKQLSSASEDAGYDIEVRGFDREEDPFVVV